MPPFVEERSGTVLLVDDDPDLLHLMTDGLELLGHYRVIDLCDQWGTRAGNVL